MENKKHQQTVLDNLRYQEQAAVDLLASQKEATDRPRLYRVMNIPTRQPEDVEMARRLSRWLCRYYSGE